MNLYDLTIKEVRNLLEKGKISSLELTQSLLKRIENTESKIHAYLIVTPNIALNQAKLADYNRSRGLAGPLTGIPAGIKDTICTKGIRTTCASRILEKFIPPYDATLISRLKAAGMVMLGKHNMDEFAMGSSTENSYFTHSHNPWDLKATPGGSSGGSAASVAAGSCFYSIGSDTGGSIRQPASYCGVVGIKPTYGLVSRYGLIAFASSLDQAGPFARTVADLADILTVIAGYDPADPTSSTETINNYQTTLSRGVKGLTLGIPREFFNQNLDYEVEKSIESAIKLLESEGAIIKEVGLPHTKYALAAYYIIAPAEASSNLARYDGVKYGLSIRKKKCNYLNMYYDTRTQGFGPEVIRRIMLGTYVLSKGYYESYYKKASQIRTLILKDFQKAFNKVNALIGPIAPTPAFKLGQKIDNPLQMYLNDIFSLSCNLTGLPSMSIPCGFNLSNRPIGLQIIGSHFSENIILAIGHSYQQNTDHHLQRPTL